MRVGGRFTANANDAVREMAIAGLGIGLHSRWDVAACIARGVLVEVPLADATPPSLGIWALWPGPRTPSPKVRVMVDTLAATLGASAT